MSRTHATATPPPTATAVVTVDPVGDTHRTLFPVLPAGAAYVVAVYRDNQLVDIDAGGLGYDVDALPTLRARARSAATLLDGAYWEPCGWCGINCAPADRAEHDRLSRSSESAWRNAA